MFVDPSHICGRRDLLSDVTQEAFNVGYEGAMIESHCNQMQLGVMQTQQITPEVLARNVRKSTNQKL